MLDPEIETSLVPGPSTAPISLVEGIVEVAEKANERIRQYLVLQFPTFADPFRHSSFTKTLCYPLGKSELILDDLIES